jgi:hypothetical protein
MSAGYGKSSGGHRRRRRRKRYWIFSRVSATARAHRPHPWSPALAGRAGTERLQVGLGRRILSLYAVEDRVDARHMHGRRSETIAHRQQAGDVPVATAADAGLAAKLYAPGLNLRVCRRTVSGRPLQPRVVCYLSTIYAWRREYAPADASAGRSASACAVTPCTSGAATARIAERSLGARSLCMGSGPSRRLR